jgi:hypothetical protein
VKLENVWSGVKQSLRWLWRWVQRFWAYIGPNAAERVAWALIVALLGLGLWLRARGYLWSQTGLWLDEASWAMRIFNRPLVQSLIRPIGFLAVSKFLASTFSNTETVLRALPWGAGVVATLISPFVARRLYNSPAARVLFVAAIALSPYAIDFSKEFKPYSLSLALHLGVILLTMRYATTERARDLGFALAIAGIGSFFAQDLVLAFPGAFLVMGLTALKRSRPHLIATTVMAVLIIVGLAIQYYVMWRNLPPDHAEFWGNKYDVFHTPQDAQGYFTWTLERYQDLVAMPGVRRNLWIADWLSPGARARLRNADEVVWVLLHVAGLLTLAYQRRLKHALLIAMPLLVLLVFNRAGFWPLGVFRTNVFTVAYSGAVAAMALDGRSGRTSVWRALAPTLILVFLPLALFERRWHAHKQSGTYDSTFPRAINWLIDARPISPSAPREIVILDRRSCDPWRYYTEYHPKMRQRAAADIKRKYIVKCSANDDDLPRDLLQGAVLGRRTWTVLHVTRPFDTMMRKGKFGSLRVVQRQDVGSHTVIALTPAVAGRKPVVEAPEAEDETPDED